MSPRADSEPTISSTGQPDRWISARCPHCFSRASTLAVEFHSSSGDLPWKVARCRDCGQMFTNPRPEFEDWDRYYPDDYPPYRPRTKTQLTQRVRWHTELRERLDRWLLGLYSDPYVFPMYGQGRLLELGCGTGEYLARMRALGWSVLGVDRSSRAVERARVRYGVPVIVGTIPSSLLQDDTFDVVTAWEVLEHLDRPRQALAGIRNLLRPTGRLVLSVPNQAGWAAEYFGPAWYGLDLPRHLTHFTIETLTRMLTSEGFRIVHRTTIRQSAWIRHSTRNARKMGEPIHRQMFGSKFLSRAASSWASRHGAGESIFVVAECSASRT